MSRTILALLAVLLLSGCASSDAWTKRDTIMQLTATGLMIIDANQTAGIQYRDDLREDGSLPHHFLGDNPSTAGTAVYFTSLAVSHYLIARALPAKWRPYYQGAVIVDHGLSVFNNCQNNLRCMK